MIAVVLLALWLGAAAQGAFSDAQTYKYRLQACFEHDSRNVALVAHFTLDDRNTRPSVAQAWTTAVGSCEGFTSLNLKDAPETKSTASLRNKIGMVLRSTLSLAELENRDEKSYNFDPCPTVAKLWNTARDDSNSSWTYGECTYVRKTFGFDVSLSMENTDTVKARLMISPDTLALHRTKTLQRMKRSSSPSIEDCMAMSSFQVTPATGDIVLLLGNTGSGKSTFAYFFAGDDSKLKSVKVGDAEYLIVDDDGKISSSSVSMTLVPNLVIDKNYSANIYDCPGFSDTRGSCADVASAYLIRKVVDKAKRVKIILFVNYSSVQQGVDRRDFVLLMQHTTKLIKNVRKFRNSIALVVSKVNREYADDDEGNPILVSDEEIKRKIIQYLEGVRIDLSRQNKTDAEQLTKIFLTRQGKDFPKIGLFKRPNKEGIVSNIKILQKNKIDLRKVIYENIKYVDHDINDLSYSIAEESKLKIRDTVGMINVNMSLAVRGLVTDMKSFYHLKYARNDDIQERNQTLWQDKFIISRTLDDLKMQNNPNNFTQELSTNMNSIHPAISDEYFKLLFQYSENWNYFQGVVDERLEADNQLWLTSFSDLENYFDGWLKWNSYLIDLYNRLGEYDVQKNRKKFIKDLQLPTRFSELNIQTAHEMVLKLESMTHHNIRDVLSIPLDEIKVSSLKDILTATLLSEVSVECKAGKVIFKGAFVKLSELQDVIKRCSIISFLQAKVVHIFALNTIFIDHDLRGISNELQLSIIAPHWYVDGSREIDLGGGRGDSWPSSADSGSKWTKMRGSDGHQGEQGGPGGAFFGVGAGFTNGVHLTVSSNGGRGGDGQQGGRGANGNPGRDAEEPNWTYGVHSSMGSFDVTTRHVHYVFGTYKEVTVHGLRGQKGGNGGDGGEAGRGGVPGIVKIIELGQHSEIKKSASVGGSGNVGKGGEGGVGGKHGDNLRASCKIVLFIPANCWGDSYRSRTYETAGNGQRGIDGASPLSNFKGKRTLRKFEENYHSVDEFKQYMQESLENGASRHRYKTFLEILNRYISMNNV